MPNWTDYSSVHDFASTPDGGYLVVSLVRQQHGPDQIIASKFTATGAVDAAFGESGVAFLKVTRPGDFVSSVKLAIHPDRTLIIAITVQDLDASFMLIRLGRLTAAGKPDPQFAAAGVTSFWVEGGARAKFLYVRPDGRIVVAGEILTQRGTFDWTTRGVPVSWR